LEPETRNSTFERATLHAHEQLIHDCSRRAHEEFQLIESLHDAQTDDSFHPPTPICQDSSFTGG